MPKIIEEHENPLRGTPLIIDIEIEGKIYQLAIKCPQCGRNDWFLREDRTGVYCRKCRLQIGYIASDIADLDNVSWAL